MVLEIGLFRQQREALEAELDQAQAHLREEAARREELDKQVACLSQELQRSRATDQAAQPVARREDSEILRAHHEKQLALAATIDGLRSDLERERARADAKAAELDAARRAMVSGSGGQGGADAHDRVARASYERKCQEVRALEDEALQLREALSGEKHKVVELKKAAHSRGAQWREQLEQISTELAKTHQLEAENLQLKSEQTRFRKELSAMTKEVERLNAECSDARARGGKKVEEMDILSNTMSGQLMRVEQELNEQVQKNAQLLDLFLRHLQQPLSTLQRCCRQIAIHLSSSEGLHDLAARQVPPLCEANVHDLKGNLVKIVNLIRYAAEVLEAREQTQLPVQGEFGLGPKPNQDSDMLSRSWFGGVFT